MPSANEPLATLKALIARRSITPEDAGCSTLIADRLAAAGFHNEWLDAEGVTNLWSLRGDSGPLVVLAGHTDVVPPGPLQDWDSDPFVPTERDGRLYGRGAADMKSGLAAMLAAVESLPATLPLRIAFLITSDEEGPCRHGTRHVVEVLRQRGIAPEHCIVGEATARESIGDRIMIGRRGSLNCRLRVLGVQGHVAYPHKADNPIHRALPALAELVATNWDEGDADFPPTSFQISNFAAGTGANNVIPGDARLDCNFRYAPVSDAASLQARFTEVLDRHSLRYEAEWLHSGAPYFTAQGELITAAREAILETTGQTPRLFTGGGTSDGRFIATLGTGVIEIGPVNATIHKVNECVDIAALATLRDIYAGVLRRLAGSR